MKAEDLLKTIEQDNGEYAGVKRDEVDYSSKREEVANNYLNEVGEVSKHINDGLTEIRSKSISK